MSNVIDTIDFEDGVVAEITPDEFCENPFAEDEAVEIVVLHSRYRDPAEGRLGTSGAEVEQWREDNAAEWFTINLWAYDHSGVVYRASVENPFTVDTEWDTAQAGIVALKRSEFGAGRVSDEEMAVCASDEEMAVYASAIADEYTDWAAGNCYQVALKDGSGATVANGAGYIGWEAVENAAQEMARNHFATLEIVSDPAP